MLRSVYNNSKGTVGWSKESYEFWKRLREYNLTLPEDKRIKVVGIDIEHQTDTACNVSEQGGGFSSEGQGVIMAFAYKDCSYMERNGAATYVDATMKDTEMLDKCSNTDITVFKLDGKESPFTKELHFLDESNGGVTTDYFQYVVLVKNSKATTLFGK